MFTTFEAGKSFFVMNTQVNALVCVPERLAGVAYAALGEVESLFNNAESILSRFNPDSELSRLNASAGKLFQASSILFEVVEAALQASRDTGGLFDPTILPELQAAGYDRSFEKVGERIKAFAVLKEDVKGVSAYDLLNWPFTFLQLLYIIPASITILPFFTFFN